MNFPQNSDIEARADKEEQAWAGVEERKKNQPVNQIQANSKQGGNMDLLGSRQENNSLQDQNIST